MFFIACYSVERCAKLLPKQVSHVRLCSLILTIVKVGQI